VQYLSTFRYMYIKQTPVISENTFLPVLIGLLQNPVQNNRCTFSIRLWWTTMHVANTIFCNSILHNAYHYRKLKS